VKRPRLELTLALCTVLLGACAKETSTDSSSRTPTQTEQAEPAPKIDLEQLEERMLGASRVEFEFAIESEGAVASHFTGRVRWIRDGEFTLTAEGEFVGQPQQLELRGDATSLATIVGSSEQWSGARPPELIDAVVLGLSHMGLLHNLAMLVGGKPPDHAEGGAREWLDRQGVEPGVVETREGEEIHPLEFTLIVGEQEVGRATLWLDAKGLPVERQQTVQFPEGEMRVVERYSNFVVEP
jgi:hypothetical protein